MNMGIYMNIRWNIVSPAKHCYGYEQCYVYKIVVNVFLLQNKYNGKITWIGIEMKVQQLYSSYGE